MPPDLCLFETRRPARWTAFCQHMPGLSASGGAPRQAKELA